MKIKTTKKLNLYELIEYVWENGVYPSVWKSEESPSDEWTIQFFEDGMFRSYNGFHDYDTFRVTVEEELTEETEIKSIVCIRKVNGLDNRILQFGNTSINTILEDDERMIKMYAFNSDELDLIWSKDLGIPKSGVLEVE